MSCTDVLCSSPHPHGDAPAVRYDDSTCQYIFCFASMAANMGSQLPYTLKRNESVFSSSTYPHRTHTPLTPLLFSCSYTIGEEANVTCTECGHEIFEDDTTSEQGTPAAEADTPTARIPVPHTTDTSVHPLHDDFREKVDTQAKSAGPAVGVSAQSSSGGSSSASSAPQRMGEAGQAGHGDGDGKRMMWRTRCHTLDPSQVRARIFRTAASRNTLLTFARLRQVRRLQHVLSTRSTIQGVGDFPSLHIRYGSLCCAKVRPRHYVSYIYIYVDERHPLPRLLFILRAAGVASTLLPVPLHMFCRRRLFMLMRVGTYTFAHTPTPGPKI